MDGDDRGAPDPAYKADAGNSDKLLPKVVGFSQLRYVFAYPRLAVLTGTGSEDSPKTSKKPYFHKLLKKY